MTKVRSGDLDMDPCSDDILTKEQITILQMIADGLTLRQVGLSLTYSEQFIKNKMFVIRERLEAESTCNAIAIALRRGYID